MGMTNEEIDAEIARLTALKEQNNAQQAETNNPANGIYNPADYISQITKALDEQRLDGSMNRGNKFSSNLELAKDAGRRTGFEQDKDGTPLPETAYEWIVQQMNAARAKGPVSKYTLRAIENGAKVRYNLPTDFDISGKGFFSGNTDKNLAKAMNSLPYNGNAQVPSQNNTKTTQSQTTGKKSGNTPNTPNPQITGPKSGNTPTTQITGKSDQSKNTQNVSPKTKLDDERTAAYKRIKAKQATDADLALFKDYTEEQLRKIGFGTISIKAIKGAAGTQAQQTDTTQQTSEGLSDEEKQFMQQYKQYTQQLSGARPSSQAVFKAMQESDAHKFVTDPANTERYNNLVKKQNEAKKANKQNKTDKNMTQKIAAAKEDNAAYGDMGTFGE